MSLAPKYSLTHLYTVVQGPRVPHQVNLYLDYTCPFSAKIFYKILNVIPELEKKHKGSFLFAFFNVIQPWHPSATVIHEYSLAVAQLLREKKPTNSNSVFWNVSKVIFEHQTEFYDTATADVTRNDLYKRANDIVFADIKDLPFTKEEVFNKLYVKPAASASDYHNEGNLVSNDVKYFTKYLRGVGVHVTPTVSVDGVVDGRISSGDEVSKLVQTLETYLEDN